MQIELNLSVDIPLFKMELLCTFYILFNFIKFSLELIKKLNIIVNIKFFLQIIKKILKMTYYFVFD